MNEFIKAEPSLQCSQLHARFRGAALVVQLASLGSCTPIVLTAEKGRSSGHIEIDKSGKGESTEYVEG